MSTTLPIEARRIRHLATRIEDALPVLSRDQVRRLRRCIDEFADAVRELLGPLE